MQASSRRRRRSSITRSPATGHKTWAAELGLNQAVKLLETTLGEEKKTDETLTKLAQSEVNQRAQAA
jgi:ferritin-like metal-binding protein YciE